MCLGGGVDTQDACITSIIKNADYVYTSNIKMQTMFTSNIKMQTMFTSNIKMQTMFTSNIKIQTMFTSNIKIQTMFTSNIKMQKSEVYLYIIYCHAILGGYNIMKLETRGLVLKLED